MINSLSELRWERGTLKHALADVTLTQEHTRTCLLEKEFSLLIQAYTHVRASHHGLPVIILHWLQSRAQLAKTEGAEAVQFRWRQKARWQQPSR